MTKTLMRLHVTVDLSAVGEALHRLNGLAQDVQFEELTIGGQRPKGERPSDKIMAMLEKGAVAQTEFKELGLAKALGVLVKMKRIKIVKGIVHKLK